jgi:hypothetical protein
MKTEDANSKPIQLENYIQFEFRANESILISTWKTTIEMSDEEYQKVILKYVEEVNKNKAQYSLLDTRKAAYTVHPEMQEWVNEQVSPLYNEGSLEKTAFLMSEHFIVQISVEQVVDEGGEKLNKQRQFFDSIEKAEKWLFENK